MLASGYSETDEDSAVIAAKVKLGLEARGMTTSTHAIGEDGIPEIQLIKADCIFNLVEWCGQDIELSRRVFKYLRKLDIPVTGASEELFVLTGDKARMKVVLQELGMSTPRGLVFGTGSEQIPDDLPYPMIVKPSLEHCSMGLTKEAIASDEGTLRAIVKKQLATFKQPALAEEFVVGRELLVYLLEEKAGVQVLPIEEVIFSNGEAWAFQTYQAKWEVNHPDYQTSRVVVAKLTAEEQKAVESVCRDIFNKMGFCGYSRFDVRLKNGIPYILEANANPSVYDGDGSLTDPEEEVITGIKFGDYLERIVASANEHYYSVT
jgi:D-alanine-D-alanine ligase